MMNLALSTDLISLITSAAATVDVHASWVDDVADVFTPGKQNTAISTATTTTIVSAPGSGVRNVKFLSIRNKHATTTTNVTVQYNANSTLYELFKCPLSPGEELVYRDGWGWSAYDAAGNIQQGYTPPTGLLRPIINVTDYGATGDGTTNDYAAIQNAINAAGVAGVSSRGVDVYFPAGVYAVSATLTCPYNNVMLRGSGWQSTVLMATFTTTDILQLGDGTTHSGCGLTDMSVWCNAARTTGASININNMADVLITNFVINNCFTGILIQGASIKVWIDRGEINNTHPADGIGISVVNGAAGDTYISNIVMSNGTAPLAGIQLTQTGHTSLFRCNITKCATGLLVNPTANQDVTYLFIDHCLFDSCTTRAAYFYASAAATARIRSVVCVNSWFSGTTGGTAGLELAIANSAIVDGIRFVGCRVLNNYNHGVVIGNGPTNLAFTTCIIAGNGAQTINTYDGVSIAANASGISFIGCTVGQSGAAGNQQRYAFNIAAGTTSNLQILYCDLAPNGTVGTGNYINLGALSGLGNLIAYNNPQSSGLAPASLSAPASTSGTNPTVLLKIAIPANAVKIGDQFQIELHGISSSTGTLIFRVYAGPNGTTSDNQAWISITSAAQVANQRAGFSGLLTVRSLTAVQCECVGYAQAALLPTVVGAVGNATIASTAVWYIDLACTCSVGTFTAQQATIIPL